MTQRVADVMAPGDHGSTFAGNPLVCAAANATFDIIADPAFLAEVSRKGEKLRAGLLSACQGCSHFVVRSAAPSCICTHAPPAGMHMANALLPPAHALHFSSRTPQLPPPVPSHACM